MFKLKYTARNTFRVFESLIRCHGKKALMANIK